MNEPTVVISGRGLFKDYMRLKAEGWKTLWSGNGKICLQAPSEGFVPEPVEVIREVKA